MIGPWLYTPNGLRLPSGPVALYTRMCSVADKTGSPADLLVATSGRRPTHRGKYFDGGTGGEGGGGGGCGGPGVHAWPRQPDVQCVLCVSTQCADASVPPKQWWGATSWFQVQMSHSCALSHSASHALTVSALPRSAECGPAPGTASILLTTFHSDGGGGAAIACSRHHATR